MSGPTLGASTPATSRTCLPADRTSPWGNGLFVAPGSSGVPHTPTGYLSAAYPGRPGPVPKPSTSRASRAVTGVYALVAGSCRSSRTVRVDVRSCAPIGLRPRSAGCPLDRVVGTATGAPPRSNVEVGIVVVKVISNSANTWNGNASLPSLDGAPVCPPVEVGNDPRPVIEDRARAAFPASSRYLAVNSFHSNRFGSTLWGLPKSTGTVAGPISNSACPAKSGPQTLIVAPRVMLKLIVNRPRSRWMPAEIRANAETSNQNGSK